MSLVFSKAALVWTVMGALLLSLSLSPADLLVAYNAFTDAPSSDCATDCARAAESPCGADAATAASDAAEQAADVDDEPRHDVTDCGLDCEDCACCPGATVALAQTRAAPVRMVVAERVATGPADPPPLGVPARIFRPPDTPTV